MLVLGAVSAGGRAPVATEAVKGTRDRAIAVMARKARYVMNVTLSHLKDALGLFVIDAWMRSLFQGLKRTLWRHSEGIPIKGYSSKGLLKKA